MTRYAVALGSNQGDRLGHMQAGVAALEALGEVSAIAGLYETAPIGGPAQNPYLNSVAVVESELPPGALLAGLHTIEGQQGRERSVRFGARTLDLDIVASDGSRVDDTDLQIPHPRASERRFVLQPLAEVWPGADVGQGRSAALALEGVSDQEVDLLAREWADPEAPRPGRYWVIAQLVWFLAIAIAIAYDGSLPGGEPEVTRLVGGGVIVVGGLLAFLSVRRLGRSLTAVPEPLREAVFVASGPYALARHPIYGGVSLLLLGTSLALASLVATILSLGLLAFFWLKSDYEERQLRIAYPEYRAYRRRVRRRMIPFLI